MRQRLDQRHEPRERVPSLEQTGDTFHVPLRKDDIKHRGQEMQRLAAEKIHGPDGFQKQDGGGGHAPLDNGVRGALEQRDISRSKRLLLTMKLLTFMLWVVVANCQVKVTELTPW